MIRRLIEKNPIQAIVIEIAIIIGTLIDKRLFASWVLPGLVFFWNRFSIHFLVATLTVSVFPSENKSKIELYHEPLGFVNSGGSQSSPDLKDREESNIASILPTRDPSKMGCSDGPPNSQNLTARGIKDPQNRSVSKKNYLYWPISVKNSDYPSIDIEIENKVYRLNIDLGASIQLTLQEKILDSLKEKISINNVRSFSDFKGNERCSKLEFLVPELNLQGLKIKNVNVRKENVEFLKYCEIVPPGTVNEQPLSEIDGRIGVHFFETYACLFKLSDSMIYLAKNIADLKSLVCFQNYIEVPMERLSGGLIAVFIELDMGVKKFILDTGASGALFRESLIKNKNELLSQNLTKQMNDNMWLFRSTQLKLGGVDFGNQNFWLFELGSGWEDVDGFIGIDFFKKHAVCFDFENRKIYIERPRKNFWQNIFNSALQLF